MSTVQQRCVDIGLSWTRWTRSRYANFSRHEIQFVSDQNVAHYVHRVRCNFYTRLRGSYLDVCHLMSAFIWYESQETFDCIIHPFYRFPSRYINIERVVFLTDRLDPLARSKHDRSGILLRYSSWHKRIRLIFDSQSMNFFFS